MTTDRSILVLNRLRAMLHGRGMLTATPDEFAKAMKIPVAEWLECVKRLRANKRVACNLEKPDRRGRVTIWIQRALKDQRAPRDLSAIMSEDTRTLGEALGNALEPLKSKPDVEFLSGVESGTVAHALMQISLVAASLALPESKVDVQDQPEDVQTTAQSGDEQDS